MRQRGDAQLANVGKTPQLRRSASMATATSMGYCMKCKTQRDMQDPEQITMKNGRQATQGTCPMCGTKIFKIGAAK